MSHVFKPSKQVVKSFQFTMLGKKCSSYYIINKKKVFKDIFTKSTLLHSNCLRKYNNCDFSTRRFSSFTLDDFLNTNEDDIVYSDFENDVVLGNKENIRSLLYHDSNDHILTRLNCCHSIQNIFDLIRIEEKNMLPMHLCQSILVLWDLQKSFDSFYIQELEKNDIETSPQAMMNSYITELNKHPDFQNLLQLLKNNRHMYNADELSSNLFYLKKMGIDMENSLMDSMFELFHERIQHSDNLTLLSLARYTSLFEARESLRFIYISADILPHLLKFLDNCNSAEDLRILTISLFNVHSLISNPILQLYKKKVEELVTSGAVQHNSVKCVIRILNFLNLPHWSKHNTQQVEMLCKLIKNSFTTMGAIEIINIHKVFQSYLSPADIMISIKKRVATLLEESKSDDRVSTFVKIPDLLFCQVTGISPNNRHTFEALAEKYLKYSFQYTYIPIYKILRYLKAPNSNICDKFWLETANFVANYETHDYRLQRIIQKYMYFYSNSNNLYRCLPFEDKILKKTLDLENSLAIMIPSKFARITAFYLAYGLCKTHFENYNLLNLIVTKLEEITDQLDHLSCLILSKGLNIASIINKNKYLSPKTAQFLIRVETVLDHCARRHLEATDMLITDMNIIFKTFVNRKARYDTQNFNKLLTNYSKLENEFSSRSIRDAAYNLSTCSVILPPLYSQIIEYVVEQNTNLLGETAQKILNLCYSTGYHPKSEQYFHVSAEVISRDKEIVSGLSLLQACTAMCFYGHLPGEFIKYIFSIEFMERLDKEIAYCYSKGSYPFRVRKQLMYLNRCVCLELPEYEIPWFHEKYVQERISSKPFHDSVFKTDILESLKHVINQKEAIKQNYFSPYGYELDFLVLKNKNNFVLPTPTSIKDNTLTKIAILLINPENFNRTITIDENLQTIVELTKGGPTKSKIRHLELMGYQVIEISSSFWNSMHMAEPNEKIKFLYDQIWNIK